MALKASSGQQVNIDSIKDGCDSLVAFSNHLMLVLVAVIALASNAAFQGHNYTSKALFSCGIVVSIFSLYWGYSANIAKINEFLRTGADFKLLPREERIISGVLSTIKKYVQWQYVSTVFSIICIAASILNNIYFDYSNEQNLALCVQKVEEKSERPPSSASNEAIKDKSKLDKEIKIPHSNKN